MVVRGYDDYLTHVQLGAPEDAEINRFTTEGLFSTLTNVNFDPTRFRKEFIPKVCLLVVRTCSGLT